VTWLDLAPTDAAQAIADWVAGRSLPAFRARQIQPYLWERPVRSWLDASDLPRELATALDRDQSLARPNAVARQQSADGTIKFLWRFPDGAEVESVLIPEGRRRTLCISSQAGCAYGCVFCATGRMGFGRHLTPWEIGAQVREVLMDPSLARPTHVVFMGMGEPLHNWTAVDTALSILNDPHGLGIAARRITVSTVGLVPGLRALAARSEQFGVAWSLHSPRSDHRAAMMPVERKYPIPDVVEALRAFHRRLTLEYVLISDRNDAREDARALARIALDLRAHVNLLPLHPGGAPTLTPSPPARIAEFAGLLRAEGVNVTVRRSRGLDIAAACGQLRVVAGGGVSPQEHGHVEEQTRIGIQ